MNENCVVCGRHYSDCWRDDLPVVRPTTRGAANAECYCLGYKRQKADNASLLESLRAWKEGVCQDCVDREPLLAAAEQRSEAAEKEIRAAAGPNLTDGLSDNATLVEHVARLRRIVDNHDKQCGDFVVQRNSAWRRLIEIRKAKIAAEQRTTELEGALRAIAQHTHCVYPSELSGPDGQYGIGVSDGHRCAATIARAALHDEERGAPPQEDGAAAQGEEK